MFTGIVVERGRVAEEPAPSGRGGRKLVVSHSDTIGSRLEVGASLAVSGVCLTVVEAQPDASVVEVSPETLSRTTLGNLGAGREVNLEPPLRAGDPLGGHWVQGHVDGVVQVVSIEELTDHRVMRVELPRAFRRYLVEKGSVALDGVSLTVAERADAWFSVALIPHTLEITTLGSAAADDQLNLEVDILAKYVESMLGDR